MEFRFFINAYLYGNIESFFDKKGCMKITLITACLNSQDTIQKTFNSVLNQNYKNIEHIIIDGESVDATKISLAEAKALIEKNAPKKKTKAKGKK